MGFNNWMRQIHRWLSIIFTVGFVTNIVAYMHKVQIPWLALLALLPLVVLLITGLYLFVLPYALRRRG